MISIIVTFYNTEKYIKECLDSIKNQTYNDFEVIMVNDGSTDLSRAIALSYTEDIRFKLFDIEHSGYPEAKNKGLSEVLGDYVIFLDSDDVADKHWLEYLHNIAIKTEADIVTCNYYHMTSLVNVDEAIEDDLNAPVHYFNENHQKMTLLFRNDCLCYMWNKLIKKELYENIHFEDCVALSDVQVMYKIFDKANNVYSLSRRLVYYRRHDDSISATTRDNNEYWKYRIDLFLKVFTFVFDKYSYAKFAVRKFLDREIKKAKAFTGEAYFKDYIYEPNKERFNHLIEPEYDCDFPVDLVVTYVDNTDPVWQKALNNDSLINNIRFRDPGLFEFFLKGVDKYMPWIRKIHLIVSNIEQVPDYINKSKTNIVLHKDIIPEEYLPTFNSQTIEMFIWKIKDLAEHFIYSNDDMYPINMLKKSDYFTADGKPKIIFKRFYIHNDINMFGKVCVNNYRHVSQVLNKEYEMNTYLKTEHTMTAMVKSHCEQCFELMKNYIMPHLERFRNNLQHNQYIFPLYERFTRNYEFGGPRFEYRLLINDTSIIKNILLISDAQVLCINGTGEGGISNEALNEIKSTFRKKLNG